MRLYIIRHAWAEEADSDVYPDDELRPLSREGRKRFRKFARWLVRRGVVPGAIATSPLLRCRETADLLAAALKKEHRLPDGSPAVVEIVEHDALRPGSSLEALLEWTRQQSAVAIAWVGHAPDVGELTAALVGDGGAAIDFSKGAVAAIDTERMLSGSGQLRWLLTAKSVGQ